MPPRNYERIIVHPVVHSGVKARHVSGLADMRHAFLGQSWVGGRADRVHELGVRNERPDSSTIGNEGSPNSGSVPWPRHGLGDRPETRDEIQSRWGAG